ncbi:MAG TPA: hypothetical protein PLF31_01010 [Candidatus Paceibacterota bacterium]|nr:hypothetical protein [Candidatus Paceibacterota bacterium]
MNPTIGYFRNIGDVMLTSVQEVAYQFIVYVPQVVGAIIVVILGVLIASLIGSIVRKIVKATKVDDLIGRSGINEKLHAGSKYVLLSGALGEIAKWLIIIATLMAASDILNLPQITAFLSRILFYIPQVFVAVVILTIGLVASSFASRIVESSLQASQVNTKNRKRLASIAKYAIIAFSVMAALLQLGIAPELIQILTAGIVLALALAFGLGGKEEAARFLHGLREEN